MPTRCSVTTIVTRKRFSAREVLGRIDPMHLWFLEYLLLFYAIALVAIPLSIASIKEKSDTVHGKM